MKQDPGLELTVVKFNSIYAAKYDRDIDSSSIIISKWFARIDIDCSKKEHPDE